MQHDAVLYGEHKYRDLVEAVGRDRVLCVIDDLPKMIDQAMGLGLTGVLRSQPYNGWWHPDPDSSGRLFHARSVVEYQGRFDRLMEERNG